MLRASLILVLCTIGAAGTGFAQGAYVVTAPPVHLGVSDHFQKHVSANGYPVIGSDRVNDYALKEAAYLINMLLANRPDVRRAMIDGGSMMIVMAHNEFTTDVPQHSHLRPVDHWDRRARGLGGSRSDPVCSSAEENLLAFEGDPYSTENILIHEFAHNIHLVGMSRVDPTFDARVESAFERAMAAGTLEIQIRCDQQSRILCRRSPVMVQQQSARRTTTTTTSTPGKSFSNTTRTWQLYVKKCLVRQNCSTPSRRHDCGAT